MRLWTCLFATILGIAAPAAGQECKPLEPAESLPGDQFGCTVSTDGKSVAVSANGDDDETRGILNAGSVTVFDAKSARQNPDPIFASDAAPGDQFGIALAIDENILVVGAPGVDLPSAKDAGAVYVLQRIGSDWKEEGLRLTAGSDVRSGAFFGESVALRKDRSLIVVGAPSDSGDGSLAGAVYVFTRAPGAGGWTRTRLKARPDPFDGFGFSVAIEGDILVVGAPFADGSKGEVWIFRRRGSEWELLRRLTAGSFARSGAQFGSSVSLSGTVLAVAATRDDPDDRTDAGAVYLFSSDVGSLLQRLAPSDLRPGDLFGSAVALDGNRILVGARMQDKGAGAVYLFERGADGRWQETEGPPAQRGGELGQSLALQGDQAVVGSYRRQGDAGDAESCSLDEELLPDLTCQITGPPTLTAGGQATYSIKITNAGKGTATGVDLLEPKAPGAPVTSAGGPCNDRLPCLLGSIEANDSVSLAVTLQVPPGCSAPASIHPQFTVQGNKKESDTGNNTCKPLRATRVARPPMDLVCEKTGPASTRPGELLIYQVKVRNLGCEPALDVEVADPTPPDLERDCDGFPCPVLIPRIPAEGAVTVRTAFQVSIVYPRAEVVNEAQVSQARPQEPLAARANNLCSATTPFRCLDPFRVAPHSPRDLPLGLWGVVEGPPAEVEEDSFVSYEIVLVNGGPGVQPDNYGHELEHVVPDGLSLTDATSDRGKVTVFDIVSPPIGNNTLLWDGSLAPCETVTIKVKTKVVGDFGSEVCLQGLLSFDLDRNGTNEASRTTGLRGGLAEGASFCFRIVSGPPD